MKVKDLQRFMSHLDPDMDVFSGDPDRSGIVWELDTCRVETVSEEKQFAPGEFSSYNFPIGYKFLKLE